MSQIKVQLAAFVDITKMTKECRVYSVKTTNIKFT